MSFGAPHLLFLLLAVAALAVIDQLRRGVTRRPWPQILRLRAHATKIETAPGTTAPERRWRLWVGLALLVIALAAPRAGFVQKPVEPPPREIIIAMDLSRSMLARDVKPSRMDHARLLAAALVEKTVHDRLGLVLFSSSAYLQLPLSTDYGIITEMMPHLSPAYFPKSGTNFAAMLTASLGAFSTTAETTERYLVVLSDGEAFGDEWKASLPELKKRGIRVLSVGIGTKTGDLLLTDSGTLRNTSGAEVVSRLNSATLEELATATGGVYSPGESWVDLQAVVKAASPISNQPVTYRVDQSQLVERYRWLVLPALLVLAWSFWREFPVKPALRQVRLSAPAALAARLAPNPRTAAAAVAVALAALLALPPGLPGQDADDQRAQMDDPRSPLRALAALVTQRINGILTSPKPNANDCVSLAIDIIAYCDNTHRARQRFPLSIIDDAMLAIDWGERMERDGGAWDKLRADLRALRKANIEPWKNAKPDAAGVSDVTPGFDPATEMKNDKHASGFGIASSDTTAADAEAAVKGSFADTPAFGDMGADKHAVTEPDEAAPESDQQVVGGKKSSADAERERNPELVLPLQKLEIVRRGDTPAKLFQMLEAKRNEFVPLSPEW